MTVEQISGTGQSHAAYLLGVNCFHKPQIWYLVCIQGHLRCAYFTNFS